MTPDPSALNWNSLLSALIGGGVALAGVFWAARLDREARQVEEKARFQRDTLIDLQDTLETFLRAVYSLDLWREAPTRWEKSNRRFAEAMKGAPAGLDTLPPFDHRQHSQELTDEGHLATFTDSRFRLQGQASRVDNEAVRTDVAQLVEASRPVLTQDVFANAEAIAERLNATVGLLIREGTVAANGFVAPKQTTRKLP